MPRGSAVIRYDGARGPVFHVDAYRLRASDDARDLGFADMLGEAGVVVIVEWPERLGTSAPAFTHRIGLQHTGDPLTRLVEQG